MSALANALARGAILLTPNQRAARAIARDFNAHQATPLWAPANVLALETWLASLWTERIVHGETTRILLNRTQEHSLWREIIAADPDTPRLCSADALAEMAARAWSLACRYNARSRVRDYTSSTDSRAFERWSRLFERRLTQAQYITTAELPAALAAFPTLPQTPLALVDFDAHPPAISSFLAALEAQGVEIETIRSTVKPASASLHIASDDRDELLTAAHWVRDFLAQEPAAQIAIVVPNLEERRAEIERVFAPVLAPESLPITSAPSSPVFEFSLGRTLADLPIAQTALDLLTWTHQPLSLEHISALLLSPWFGEADAAAAEFDAFHVRRAHLLRPELSMEAALKLLDKPGSSHIPGKMEAFPPHSSAVSSDAAKPATRTPLSLATRLRALHQAAHKARLPLRTSQAEGRSETHAQWADDFRILLHASGWSRNAQSNSLAFQQHRRWESVLDELATLDFERTQITFSEALSALRGILAQTVFAPESQNAPVQIIGALEVAGTAFDALWFLGADDLAWPASVTSSPLLPWQLQRALGMPGADRAFDDNVAQSLTSRIAHAADEVVFSYAARSEEGERRPSPLLADLHLTPFSVSQSTASAVPRVFEDLLDNVQLPPLPDGPVRGGAQILKLQAACAFRAFAEQRLFSSEPESRDPGLDARERGSLIHKVMELFWSDVKTQANLSSLDDHQRAVILSRAIAEALFRTRPESSWEDAYLRVQQQRLIHLLMPWLDIEAARPLFEVQPVEQKKSIQLGPLTLDLRIDRIDSTSHGDLILDYKTGLAAPAQWLTDRPEEPQLPLYAVLTQQAGRDVAGVAFALLRPGEGLDIKGFADDEDVFGKTGRMNAATLAEQIEDWHLTLTKLAEAYAHGDSRVEPRDYPTTCQHCSQRTLCRLDPELLDLDPDPETENEGEPTYG